VASRIEYPLKAGDPFYCDLALSNSNVLCTWQDPLSGQAISECLVDLVEKLYGLHSETVE
jgi:hypothetical protein